jgi:non-specific serine/threonine protein kinase
VPEPTPEEAQERYPAVRLFADRAAAASHTFALSTGNVGVVAELCRRLDGLPLPIELAAAWSAVLPPEEMVARLSDRFQMLEAGANRPADPRHQTLRGTIDWSYDLLAEPERVLLRRLSVFPGGFTIDAAEKVCADDTALPRIAVLTGLMRLVRKSLVAQDDSAVPSPEVGAATPLPRYRLLETIREYGAELLAAHPDEAAAVRARHLDHYLALGEEAEPHLFSSSPRAWLDRLELEHGNIRAALTHEGADPLKRLRLAVAVYWFWHVRGHLIEGKNHIVRLLTDCEDTVPSGFKCRALKAYGILAMNTGEYEEAETRLREALELYRAESNSYEMSGCLHNLALVAQRRERYADARSLFEEAIATGRPFPNESREAVFLANYASLLYDTGAFDAASDILVRATAIQRKSGNLSALAAGLTTLGASEFRRGRLASAIRALTEAVEASYALGTGPSLVPAMTCLSEVAHAARDFESSALLIGAASAVTTERVVNRINAERFGPIADDITRHIGSEPFATLRHRGANLSEAEVRDIAHRLAGCEEAGYNRSS